MIFIGFDRTLNCWENKIVCMVNESFRFSCTIIMKERETKITNLKLVLIIGMQHIKLNYFHLDWKCKFREIPEFSNKH